MKMKSINEYEIDNSIKNILRIKKVVVNLYLKTKPKKSSYQFEKILTTSFLHNFKNEKRYLF